MNATGELGCANQKVMVTHSAARLASHAATHGRSSTRRMERASTTKNTAITMADAICAVVLQRQSSSSMRKEGRPAGRRRMKGVVRGRRSSSGDSARHARAPVRRTPSTRSARPHAAGLRATNTSYVPGSNSEWSNGTAVASNPVSTSSRSQSAREKRPSTCRSCSTRTEPSASRSMYV